jgi:hypothetical protein
VPINNNGGGGIRKERGERGREKEAENKRIFHEGKK